MSTYAEVSGAHQRRLFSSTSPYTYRPRAATRVVISSTLNAGPPPVAVPLLDAARPNARVGSRAHQRVLVRPGNLVTPSVVYDGDAIQVVQV
jgi:hypothetical protein